MTADGHKSKDPVTKKPLPTSPAEHQLDHQNSLHTKNDVRAFQPNQWWWSINTVLPFTVVHLLAIYGTIFVSPIHRVSYTTIMLCLSSGLLGSLGITMGYHRLWSHRSFVASEPLRWFLALAALLGQQGSIKWWVLRHRIHHRWTDTEHDPYSAKRGLFFSHIGWMARNPLYEKLHLIDRSDLDRDRVVVFQHRYYYLLSTFIGYVLPYLLSTYVFKSNVCSRWDGLIWGGFVVKIWVWHSAFTTNSLAHFVGYQPFNIDLTARSYFPLAFLTLGEGNHNFHHLFAKDYRSGPAKLDWDPTKWMIYLLYRYTGLVTKILRTPESEIEHARQRIIELKRQKEVAREPPLSDFPSFEDLIYSDIDQFIGDDK